MKWHHLSFLCIMAICAMGADCDSRTPVYTPDPTIPRLEHDFLQTQKEIKNTQQKVRALLTMMVTEIEDGNIDAARAASDVEQTTDEIKRLNIRIRKLRGVPENVARPSA